MTQGIERSPDEAAWAMAESARKWARKQYKNSKRFAQTIKIGEDYKGRVIANHVRTTHRYTRVSVGYTTITTKTEMRRNLKTAVTEEITMHWVDGNIVFEIPGKRGWYTDTLSIACLGLRYLENNISPTKKQKIERGSAHARKMLERHRDYYRVHK